MSTPYYQRALDDFNDEIITRARPSNDGTYWYASLDTGFRREVSDPDFTRSGRTQADAIRDCAHAIRQDALGLGKFAPHSVTSGYDLHFRLAPHWAMKERVRAAGQNPSAFLANIERDVTTWDHWNLEGEWLDTTVAKRMMEARLRVGFLDLEQAVADGTPPQDAAQTLLDDLRKFSRERCPGARATPETWKTAETRISFHLLDIAPSAPRP